MKNLDNRRVAILATNGFEESEFTSPRKALEQAGAKVDVISPSKGKVRGWSDGNWSNEYDVTYNLDEADSNNYDALMIPGGVLNPDQLRMNEKAVRFVKSFFKEGKPIAVICHGPQVLIETGALQGRKLTSYPSIRTDLENAGAQWVNEEVVVDSGLTTSRKPEDLEAFNRKMIEEFAEGVHQEQKTL